MLMEPIPGHEPKDPLSRFLRWQYRVRVWVLRKLGRLP